MSLTKIVSPQATPLEVLQPKSRAADGVTAQIGNVHSMLRDRIECQTKTHTSIEYPRHGFGVGLTTGVSVEAGVVAGAGATASAAIGLFTDGKSLHPGISASAGSFAGLGTHGRHTGAPTSRVAALGAYAGAGIGAFVTNAASVSQLAGAAQTYSLNIGVGPLKVSLQLGSAQGTFVGALTIGPGLGVDASSYSTQTVVRSQ